MIHNCLPSPIDALAPRIPESVEISSITPTSATIQFTLTDPFVAAHPEGFVVMYGPTSGQLNSNSSVITATSSSQTYSHNTHFTSDWNTVFLQGNSHQPVCF